MYCWFVSPFSTHSLGKWKIQHSNNANVFIYLHRQDEYSNGIHPCVTKHIYYSCGVINRPLFNILMSSSTLSYSPAVCANYRISCQLQQYFEFYFCGIIARQLEGEHNRSFINISYAFHMHCYALNVWLESTWDGHSHEPLLKWWSPIN